MLLSNAPSKLLRPFADAGGRNSIPVASQIGVTPGAASLTDGFPPLTRTPVAAGGVPPSGQDMNGVLFEVSAITRWANAGGGYPFDGTFAADTNVNGYPKGSRVLRSDGQGYWLNTVDNNVTDPESSGSAAAGWVPDTTSGTTSVTMTGSSVTLTAPQYGRPIIEISGALTANLNLIFPAMAGRWVIRNNTTGPYSITAKTAAGTGTIVPRGPGLPVFGNGPNLYSALDTSGRLNVKWFGAVGDGAGLISPVGTDDTIAIQAAINSNVPLYFPPGFYTVSTVNFNSSGGSYYFDNAYLVCGATSATQAGVIFSCWNSTFWGFKCHLNWNTNYICGVQWYNAAAASQYNTFFGFEMFYGYRGLVYGEIPGNTSTPYAQSENQVYGFRTRGVQNPFYGNHSNGFIFFSEPIFVAHNEEWAEWAPTKTFDWTAARAFENVHGTLVAHGGELQRAGSQLGFAADFSTCLLIGTVIETACPNRIIGTDVRIEDCRHWMTADGHSEYVYASHVGNASLTISKGTFSRAAGLGASSRHPLIDATGASDHVTNEVNLVDCDVTEWAFVRITADCPLVKGGIPRIVNTRLRQTAADANIYQIDNTREDLVETRSIDHLCYTATGWNFTNEYGSGASFGIVADGPTGYLASCMELNATGDSRVITVDETSAATIKATGFRVRPGELYTLDSWLRYVSGTNNLMLSVKFYALAGAALTTGPNGNGEYYVCDYAGVGSPGTAWTKVLAPVTVPADAAYMAVGIRCDTTVGRFTDMRLRRAS